jgi:catalase-peroxidase
MGLIYVNPEGPNGEPDPVASGRDVRETFARMAMNDEETVALVAGGHTFGKAHGAGASRRRWAPSPRAPRSRSRASAGATPTAPGRAATPRHSGIEGAWKPNPTRWDHGYFEVLFGYEWELVKSPAGAHQWRAKDVRPEHLVADAHDPTKRHAPMMTTADLALRFDPDLRAHLPPVPRRSGRVHRRLRARLVQAHAPRSWARSAVPRRPEVPTEDLSWQDPVPLVSHPLVEAEDVKELSAGLRASGLSVAELVSTAWASASTFRGSDRRGRRQRGAAPPGPAARLGGQPARAHGRVLGVLEGLRARFAAGRADGKQISLADLIVLGGNVGVEARRGRAGRTRHRAVPPRAHRRDRGADRRGVVRGPRAPRGRIPQLPGPPRARPGRAPAPRPRAAPGPHRPGATVLVGGLRVLGANGLGGRRVHVAPGAR